MLLYHPLLDSYHCALRTLSLISDSDIDQIEWDRLRLLDLLIVFPHTLREMRVPAPFVSWKITLKEVPEPYETLPKLTRVFYQVAEIQLEAMRLLAASGLIERVALQEGHIRIIKPSGPQERALEAATSKLRHRSERWYRYIVECLVSYPLNGSGGLKERTGLMEHRHDTS